MKDEQIKEAARQAAEMILPCLASMLPGSLSRQVRVDRLAVVIASAFTNLVASETERADEEKAQARQEVAEEVAWYITGHVVAPIIVRAEKAEAEVGRLRAVLESASKQLACRCELCYTDRGLHAPDCKWYLVAELQEALAGPPESEGT